MRKAQRVFSFLCCFVVVLSMASLPSIAHAGLFDVDLSDWQSTISGWIGNSSTTANTWNQVDNSDRSYTVNNAQNYYTNVTSSVVDKSGNVTNYYRGGDTTNTKIIDSYNKTFNTVYNTNNTTNNYKANVKLENFLNQYTTNNVTNNNTYSATYKSWYYDNRTNNYNYTQNNDYNYYNTDNSRYYISIDNSTDEYYLIDVQYSPTFVTVNYTYNTTNINNEKVGNVTNVYYYELKDGRNSSTLTAAEVAGMDVGYDAANYELVTDDPNTLSLQHFDGDYIDSSSYNRSFYSENRSSQYVDSGAFGQAVKLSSGSAAGVTIPDLSSYDSLSFDFRVYYADVSNLGVYLGDTNLFSRIPSSKSVSLSEYYTDNANKIDLGQQIYSCYIYNGTECPSYLNGGLFGSAGSYLDLSKFGYSYSNTLRNTHTPPSADSNSGWSVSYSSKYGWYQWSGSLPSPTVSTTRKGAYPSMGIPGDNVQISGYDHVHRYASATAEVLNFRTFSYRMSSLTSVSADFSYSNYNSQWLSMRITLSGGNIYYFVNGDLVGVGAFTRPTADKFYIKSSGTLYLDELRVTTGSLSSTTAYNPSNAPYDTNKVLALPDTLVANTIYVQNNTPVTICRVGGVRPSNPSEGFFYIPLYEDYTGGQSQIYTGNNWINVTAMVYDGSILKNAQGFKFSPVGESPDVVNPGDDSGSDGCTHNWQETDRTEATCSSSGKVEYTCSKCAKTKTETLAKLSHNWEVKQTVQTTYDENGNVLTQGFTIYRCSVCGEEYKSTSGLPPSSGQEEEKEGFLSWLLRKAGELLGAVGEGVINFLRGVLDKLFDGLIGLVESVFENLTKLLDLFGSFGDALGVLWTWLPPEMMAVLVAGVSVFVLIALLKLVMK